MESIFFLENWHYRSIWLEWLPLALMMAMALALVWVGFVVTRAKPRAGFLIAELEKCVRLSNNIKNLAFSNNDPKLLSYYESYLAKVYETLEWFNSWDQRSSLNQSKMRVYECISRGENLLFFYINLKTTKSRPQSVVSKGVDPFVGFLKPKLCHLCSNRRLFLTSVRFARKASLNPNHSAGESSPALMRVCRRCRASLKKIPSDSRAMLAEIVKKPVKTKAPSASSNQLKGLRLVHSQKNDKPFSRG